MSNSVMQFLSKFLYLLKGKRKSFLLMLFLFIISSSIEVVGIGMVGPFIALATNPDIIAQNYWLQTAYTTLNFSTKNQFQIALGILVLVIFYIKSFLAFSIQRNIFEFSFNYQGELSCRLMHAYLAAPYTFHLKRNSANLIQNVVAETERFSNGLVTTLLSAISNLFVIVAIVVLLVQTNSTSTIVVAIILLISFFLFNSLKDKFSQWGKEGSESRIQMIQIINHSLGGLKETRIIGCENYFEQQVQREAQKYAKTISLALSFSGLPRYVIEAFLITFLIGFTFLFITSKTENPQNLSGVLGIFGLAAIRLLPATGNLISAMNGIRYSQNSLDKLYLDCKELEQLDVKESVVSIPLLRSQQVASQRYDRSRDATENQKIISFTDRINLVNVDYSYPSVQQLALADISLEINKGESIGLIGKSGSGKTTLVDVILGLLTPQSGDIQVDGVSIYHHLREWQNIIGYVPQSIFLIDDTLERNIAFGVPDCLIDKQQLDEAIQAAQLSEVIENLPNGIKTIVGERGVMLSGGQRQRVGIARTLYHGREVLVFDEATAALDNETESLVTEAIKSLSGKKTMIIIAHRLSTIEHCNTIYLLEKGRVAAAGSFDEIVLNKDKDSLVQK
jgi:ATP-binding cassette, subfamily B, bacterial PglK